MSDCINVELGERSYQIAIGRGSVDSVGQVCADCGLHGKGLLITDSNVSPLYADTARDCLIARGFDIETVVLPAGEESKSEARLFELYDAALEHGMSRDSFVVALGGGVVGDIAGYMAASYLRGIAFVQVPTTLLAMVDSSVGGKTGINLPQGKNLVGAFHQPRAVVADVDLMRTLPMREWHAGLAEVIKYGVIADERFFGCLETNLERLIARDPEMAAAMVKRSCEIKADVVRRDEREGGLRAILNYGHTLGHAIENAAGYGRYLHGEAVAIGMVFAGRLSVRLAGMPAEHADRIAALIDGVGLPSVAREFEWSHLNGIMKRDKKACAGEPLFVLAKRIGAAAPGYRCDSALCEEVWNECR